MEELQNLTPLYNKEFYLAYLCGEDVELPIPDGNTEHYLAYLCGMDVPIPDPLYTKEFYLAYKCGMDVELPEPGPHRIDQYLAKWCGMDVEVPEPMYRIEYWLAQLANSGELKTVSGNPISVSDALARPAESLVIEILPQQDLHGYDNPWPAGGGVNVLPPPSAINIPAWATVTNDNGKLTISGTSDGSAIKCTIPEFTFAAGNQRIALTNSFTGGTVRFFRNGTEIDYFSLASLNRVIRASSLGSLQGQTIDEIRIIPNPQTLSNATIAIMVLEDASGTPDWQPYSNICPISGFTGVNIYHESAYDGDAEPAYAITWQTEAGTVYGGELDVTTGVLTVTKAFKSFDGTETIYYSRNSATDGYAMYKVGANGSIVSGVGVSNMLKNVTSGVAYTNYSCSFQNSNAYSRAQIAFRFDSTYDGGDATTTIANYKAELASLYANGTPLEVCYELATPIEIQLTPTEIQMLLGDNVIWNDVGDMTLEYLADGPAEDIDALQILLGNRYVNNGGEDEATDREALDILLGGNTR